MFHLHTRIFGFVALVAALAPSAGAAKGLRITLESNAPSFTIIQPIKLTMTAVAGRSLSLPAAPVFLADDGNGPRPVERVRSRTEQIDIGPNEAQTNSYELALTTPGTYEIQAEYQVDDRLVRSNKIKVKVKITE